MMTATFRAARTRQGAATLRLGASLRPSETGVSRLARTIDTKGDL
jgi:hypothetical protein